MSTAHAGADRPVDEGGEPACMLPLLCPCCGRVPDDLAALACDGCGADLAADGGRTAAPSDGE